MGDLALGRKRAQEIGLKTDSDAGSWYAADDIHRLLSEGVVRHGYSYMDGWYKPEYSGHVKSPAPNEQCLCIGIRPIVVESEERQLLRELVKYHVGHIFHGLGGHEALSNLCEQAKCLLERQGVSK